MNDLILPTRPPRHFLPEEFSVTSWADVQPFVNQLLARQPQTAAEFETWVRERNELEAALSEELGWRYIRMTCQTDDLRHSEAYQFFIENIQPRLSEAADQLNQKMLAFPALAQFEGREGWHILLRNLRKEVEIFRTENVPVFTKINTLAQEYAQISGAMMVELDGQAFTLPQASVRLQSTNRAEREQAYRAMATRRLADRARLDSLFDELVSLRHQVARNAGFRDFRDYMFTAYGRFDYAPKDCFAFHESIELEVVPVVQKLARKRKEKLGVEALRPWDLAVDPQGRAPLQAFHGGADLLERAIRVFTRLDPYLGECLTTMQQMGHLDLESRKGKAPGGYNYPLAEIGVPFIFMNATSTLRDMTTLMHEGGHALHNFVTRHLALNEFKSPPMEVAELASMSMELLSMKHWDEFFTDKENLQRARREQIEDMMETLPWVATIDSFQHTLYEKPDHSQAEREQMWLRTHARFADGVTDWRGLEEVRASLWQKQLHVYEVPFYYIEYGFAQLGAIAVWRQAQQAGATALARYLSALRLGNLRTIPEIYAEAGIRFDFSRSYLRELMDFVQEQWENA